MKNLVNIIISEKNLIKKRNFFINLLILSSLALVFIKNFDKVRYSSVEDINGSKYTLDRFTSKIELVK